MSKSVLVIVLVVMASMMASIAVSAGCIPFPEHGVLIRSITPEDGRCRLEILDCATKESRIAFTSYVTIAMLMKHFKETNFRNVGSSPFDNSEQIEKIARQEYESTRPSERLIEMVALPLSLGCLPAFEYDDCAEIGFLKESLESDYQFSYLQARIALRVKTLSAGLRQIKSGNPSKFDNHVLGGQYLELTQYKKVQYGIFGLSVAVRRVPVMTRRIIITGVKPYFTADDEIVSIGDPSGKEPNQNLPPGYVSPNGPPPPVGDQAPIIINAPSWDPKPDKMK